MAFNFGGNQGPQQPPAFGFATPQTQSGFQFGTANPAFGVATTTAAPAPAFSFGNTGGLSFGTPSSTAASSSVFGAPTPTTALPNTTFGFGATGAAAPQTGFTFGQTATMGSSAVPAAAPAFGAPAGGSTFGALASTAPTTTAAAATMSTPFFPSGGSFSFNMPSAASGAMPPFGTTATPTATSQFGVPAPTPTSAPQFGTPTLAGPSTTSLGQPFNFPASSAATTTTTGSIFGGTGFTLGSTATSAAPSLLSGVGNTFAGLGTATSSAPSTGFQLSTAPSMPTMQPTTTSTAPAPSPFGSFGVTTSTTPLPSPFTTGLTAVATVAPAVKPVSTSAVTITPVTTGTQGFGMLPSFNIPSTATPSTTTTTPGLTFGTPTSTKISLTAFTPTATTTVTSTTATPFTSMPLGSTPATEITSTAPVAPASGFSLGQTSLFTAPKVPTPTTTSTGTSLSVTTTAPAPSVQPVTTSTAPAFTSIGLSTLLTSSTTSITPTVTDTTSGTAGTAGSQMTFRQLEEAINKWNLELSDQERIFLNQATQVNAWDRLLINNGLKIKDLQESVERVKLEQERLDHELDFIVSQQRELEDLLTPLEKALDDTPALSIQQHADLQREHTYYMAEKVDCQLKRMAEDIKQIIEHLNTSQNQDDTDPMQQVSKILNAHMDALQWVDQNTEILQKKLKDISKDLESTKKDQDSSWRINYS